MSLLKVGQPGPQFLEVADDAGSRRIAYRLERGGHADLPPLVWLSGYLSDMDSTKASALADWARAEGLTLLRFDYSGHGLSSGTARDGTIGRWLAESLAALTLLEGRPPILVGSSLGGWIALLMLRRMAEAGAPAAGAVLIAPAWDMTEALMWRQFSPEVRDEIEREGIYLQASTYAPEPYPITRALIEDGRMHLLEGSGFDPGCPVRILQGMQDADVPPPRALQLMLLLEGPDVVLTLVKDGDHRLSTPADLARMTRAIAELAMPAQSMVTSDASPDR